MKKSVDNDAKAETNAGDIEPVSGQPIDEAEKNLSRHATKESSPPVGEERRASVKTDETAKER